MSTRVYEFARQIEIKAKDILARCRELGWEIANNFSGLTDEQVSELCRHFGKKPSPAPKVAQRKAPAKAKKAAPQPKPAKVKPAKAKEVTSPETKAEKGKGKGKGKGKATKVAEKEATLPSDDTLDLEEEPGRDFAKRKGQPVRRIALVGRLRRNRVEVEGPSDDSPQPAPQAVPRVSTRLGRLTPADGDKRRESRSQTRFVPPSTIQRRPRRTPRRGHQRVRRPSVPTRPREGKVEIDTPITVRSFSEQTGVRANLIIRKLMESGQMARINDAISTESAELLGLEFGLEITVKEREDNFEERVALAATQESRPEDLVPRSPVVTFLGHVDHGKTSLLDAIRKTSVVEGEAGGITQHIGAYRAEFPDGKSVVFLDTPGHEAFTAMRARGANVTDIVVLVVAADDGVMPQTEEAVSHAKAAKVPIVVAINKCDRPDANPQRVLQQLAALEILPEDWGGDTVCVEVSALTGQGVDDLVEMLALVAEMCELKANPKRHATGTVLEAKVLEGRGIVATMLVQEGTLHRGDYLVAGPAHGRAKAVLNDRGRRLRQAGPATPIEVSGLDVVPAAGDSFYVVENQQVARAAAEQRRQRDRESNLTTRTHVSLENLFSTLEAGESKELRIILKADVKGTIEALQGVLNDLNTSEVSINVLHSGVGGVSTSDVLLADASDALIVGMQVVPSPVARSLAEEKGVEIRTYKVIYHVKEELRKALEGMLEPEEKEVIQGHAEVLQTFKSSRFGVIAGCAVRDGLITRNSICRIVREGVVQYEGRLASMRREKDDVREVRSGFECGIKIENFDDIKVGDMLEAFIIEKVRRTLDDVDASGGAKGS